AETCYEIRMPFEESVEFKNRRGQRLCGILHRPDDDPKAAAILCHGMGSNKESEKFILLGRELASRGALALRFDLAGSGESEGRFEEVTYSGEAEDIAAAYDPVAALATIAAPVHPERFAARFLTEQERRNWRANGFIVYQGLRLNAT